MAEFRRLFERATGMKDPLNLDSEFWDDAERATSGIAAFFGQYTPPFDLVDNKDYFNITMDLPGVKKEDIEIDISGGDKLLTITGNRPCPNRELEASRTYLERGCGRFQRRIDLPKGLNAEQIEAIFNEGILEISIPKSLQEDKRKSKIPIK
eukprot:TRINITY_DN239_c0_g1_i1.p1 TRINITY_DN239_c0_g1~~TRINITY_DN239_c0_g1_i1.p1  ORF type:complete len:152 (-),score=51.19 TRINITY_DN239_c0_g1_i1:203-658(-)